MLRQVGIQAIIVALIGNEDVGGGDQAGFAIQRSCCDRDVIGAIGLPKEGRAAFTAKSTARHVACAIPFQSTIFDNLERAKPHAGRRHVVPGLLSALRAMATNHRPESAAVPVANGSA